MRNGGHTRADPLEAGRLKNEREGMKAPVLATLLLSACAGPDVPPYGHVGPSELYADTLVELSRRETPELRDGRI